MRGLFFSIVIIYYSVKYANCSETPPAGAWGFLMLYATTVHEPCGLPLHHQTGVWCFMRLNKYDINQNLTWQTLGSPAGRCGLVLYMYHHKNPMIANRYIVVTMLPIQLWRLLIDL